MILLTNLNLKWIFAMEKVNIYDNWHQVLMFVLIWVVWIYEKKKRKNWFNVVLWILNFMKLSNLSYKFVEFWINILPNLKFNYFNLKTGKFLNLNSLINWIYNTIFLISLIIFYKRTNWLNFCYALNFFALSHMKILLLIL